MSCGKRTYSFSSTGSASRLNVNNNATAPAKKKKKYSRTATFVPPTKFLLGGNIRDPLNLNGLQHEDDGAGDERVRTCDDIILAPVEDFLLGGNINDPLNLKGIAEQESSAAATSATAEAAECAEAEQPSDCATDDTDEGDQESAAPVADVAAGAEIAVPADANHRAEAPKGAGAEHCVHNGARFMNLNLNMNVAAARKLERKDKIVSPVVPQPYRPLKTVPFRQIITPDLCTKPLKTPKFKEKSTRFQYGNYQRYYNYRNSQTGTDLRLEILERHRDMFCNKDVLDIGCNVGHVSFAVARSFGAKSVTGIDIDRYLIDVAKKNVQYYVNCASPYPSSSWESPRQPPDRSALSLDMPSSSLDMPSSSSTLAVPSVAAPRKIDLKYKCYPVSMPILYGPIYDTEMANESRKTFPKNIRFMHANYVPESEEQLQAEQPQYDTILCLSVTKWVHLNWGDNGLRLAFKRMYAQLKPGGILILEPQSWDSYKRKKSLTETIWRNYRSIQLFPHHFDRYLLSSEVGFSRCQTLAVVNHQHKGFRRAIKVFKKPIPSVHSLSTPPESLVERFVNLPTIQEETNEVE
ncbi:hypothetical protein V9T40_002725 [Parthenolecanium corni]|uniref:RNA methyltransferase n=1 Tax=Parthenolecanium corni TaxID=536013 RepID=A0AAN9TGN8_9HEMI